MALTAELEVEHVGQSSHPAEVAVWLRAHARVRWDGAEQDPPKVPSRGTLETSSVLATLLPGVSLVALSSASPTRGT